MSSKKQRNEKADRYIKVLEAAKLFGKPFTSHDLAKITGLSPICVSCYLVVGIHRNHFVKTGKTKELITGYRRDVYWFFNPEVNQKKQKQLKNKPTISKSMNPIGITDRDLAWMDYWKLPKAQRKFLPPPTYHDEVSA